MPYVTYSAVASYCQHTGALLLPTATAAAAHSHAALTLTIAPR